MTLRRYLFRRTRRGTIEALLLEEEAAMLASLPAELGDLVRGDPATDPIARRLYPTAYSDPTEDEAEGEFQRLMHDELVHEKLQALAVLGVALERAERRRGRVEFQLVGEEIEAWLAALNDARLALGTRLNVTEDLDYDLEGRDPADPETQAYAVYMWLGWAQQSLLEALGEG